MTGVAVPRVSLGSLTRGSRLGHGGQGTVWAIEHRKINKEWPIAYKEYSPESLAKADSAALQAMVDFIPSLDPPVGRWVSEHSAWPAAVVEDDGRVRGFLMRRVPPEFMVELATEPGVRKIAGFQYLLNGRDYIDRIGIAVGDRQRLLLLQDLAGLLDKLHDLGVAVGDLSANNLLFSLGSRPACFLIDCDAMRLRGRSVLEQVETVAWKVPDGEPLATPESDRHKFGLLAIRLFLGEQEGTDPRELASVSPELAALAAQARAVDPAARPAMRAWSAALERAIARPGARPARPAPAPSAPPNAPAPAPVPAAGPQAPASAPAWLGPRPVPVPVKQRPPGSTGGLKGAGIALAVIACIALLGVFVGRLAGAPSGDTPSPQRVGASAGADGSDSGGADGTDAGSDAQSQAAALDALLQQNSGTRGGVGAAVAAVQRCDALSDDAGVFSAAADARRSLLEQADALDVSALPGGGQALTLLEAALTSSAEADDDYVRWARSLADDGCSPDSTGHAPAFHDAAQASGRATARKKTFVAQWNPIADQYGLSHYSWDDI